MYNSISVVIFHFSWKMQSDVWGTITPDGSISHITGGNFAQSSITINGNISRYNFLLEYEFLILINEDEASISTTNNFIMNVINTTDCSICLQLYNFFIFDEVNMIHSNKSNKTFMEI